MSGYSPVSNLQVNATLLPGYSLPPATALSVQMQPGTEYDYRPSTNTNISATLAPGYTLPDARQLNATLTRAGGGTEPGQITLPGQAWTAFGPPEVKAAPGAGLTQFMFLLAQ